MLGRTDRRWRSVAILGLMCVVALAATIRLAYWQVAMAPQLQTQAAGRMQHEETEQAIRGDILDRYGRVLATTGFRDTLAAWPNQISTNRADLIARVTDILDLDTAAHDQLVAKLDPDSQYATIQRELTEAQSREIRAGIADKTLRGLVLLPHAVRIYPEAGGQPGTTLASQLLGFVRQSDGTGHYGIEGQYDAILAGRPKTVATARDRFGRSLQSSAQVIDPGADGEDVTISIDLNLQLQLEKELYAAWVSDKSKSVSALVMDPRTGELLAWASVPGYDANQSGTVATTHPDLLQDRIVTQPYEPGSVMKMVTAASALENKVITPSSRILDSSVLRFGPGLAVHNWDGDGMGKLTFRDVIAYSRNVGVSRVAARLGRNTAKASAALYRTWHKLGIGVRSGVDVPGEVTGIAKDPHHAAWPAIDLANAAFGQGVSVTPIQLATAFTPMINGGKRVQPHFLLSIADRPQDSAPPRRVLTRKVASQLQGIMHHVTSSVWWYAQGSLIPHYQVGGKTGTAQIWRSGKREWDPNTYNFTFVGYVGGDKPAAVVALHIDEANSLSHDEIKLNVTSYQLFRQVAKAIIRTQDIRRSSDPDAGLPEPGSAAERVLTPARYLQHASARGRGR
jgi:stage V sporulation protein D (sporulation-specific penicillin-binding protein)